MLRCTEISPPTSLWVKSGHDAGSSRCPLYPRKRPLAAWFMRSRPNKSSFIDCRSRPHSLSRPDRQQWRIIPALHHVSRRTVEAIGQIVLLALRRRQPVGLRRAVGQLRGKDQRERAVGIPLQVGLTVEQIAIERIGDDAVVRAIDRRDGPGVARFRGGGGLL